LLRWPEGHTGMELPVVAQAREGTQVQLLARSLEEYLHRALAEDEEGGGGGGVAAAAGSDGAGLYEAGSLAASGLPSLDAYLARKVGEGMGVGQSGRQEAGTTERRQGGLRQASRHAKLRQRGMKVALCLADSSLFTICPRPSSSPTVQQLDSPSSQPAAHPTLHPLPAPLHRHCRRACFPMWLSGWPWAIWPRGIP
jgi:hypothetical protein